jgi:hypothetical protein
MRFVRLLKFPQQLQTEGDQDKIQDGVAIFFKQNFRLVFHSSDTSATTLLKKKSLQSLRNSTRESISLLLQQNVCCDLI